MFLKDCCSKTKKINKQTENKKKIINYRVDFYY